MHEDLIDKQKAFFEAGYTLDPRGRRAVLQILANTINEKCGDEGEAIVCGIQVLRKRLRAMSRFALLKALLAHRVKSGNGGFPDPQGAALIAAGTGLSCLSTLAEQLATGNTAIMMISPGPQAEGAVVRSIIDETFTEDYVAVIDGETGDFDLHSGSADAEGDGFRVFVAE